MAPLNKPPKPKAKTKTEIDRDIELALTFLEESVVEFDRTGITCGKVMHAITILRDARLPEGQRDDERAGLPD
jgi:hypothetical protein